MQLLVSKHAEDFHGWDLSLVNHAGKIQSLGCINGNKVENNGLVILFDVDPDIVYGMSCKQVISKLLASGPQTLITVKDIAHKLYEHGMKASWGKIKLKATTLYTAMDTFYNVTQSSGTLSVIQGQTSFAVSFTQYGYEPVLLSNRSFHPKPNEVGKYILIDDVKTTVTLTLKPNILSGTA